MPRSPSSLRPPLSLVNSLGSTPRGAKGRKRTRGDSPTPSRPPSVFATHDLNSPAETCAAARSTLSRPWSRNELPLVTRVVGAAFCAPGSGSAEMGEDRGVSDPPRCNKLVPAPGVAHAIPSPQMSAIQWAALSENETRRCVIRWAGSWTRTRITWLVRAVCRQTTEYRAC